MYNSFHMNGDLIMNKNEKKLAIIKLLLMSSIGFCIGGVVYIVSGTSFLLSAFVLTITCGTLSAAQTGLISEQILKHRNKKQKMIVLN